MKLPKGFTHRFFNVGTDRLHFVEGPYQKTPLVLIPGQTMPWESYLKVLPALSARFHCFALDVRGHGQSAHTPSEYRLSTLGDDLISFLTAVVTRPALLSGNSSGGIIAAYAAAHAPDYVCAVIPEDPPFFSAEWPELKNCFVHHIFGKCVEHLGNAKRDLAGLFADFAIPSSGGQKVMHFPRILAKFIAWRAKRYQQMYPGRPVELAFLPFQIRVFVKSLSEYDVGFTQAFYDGSACDIDHVTMLQAIRCPMLLLHADWFIHKTLGLVGAMNDVQAAHAVAIVKNS